MMCASGCCVGPTLRMLSFPSDYLVTVNHGGLWQRHIAWAKPKGQDLRTYISSQYSTSMVLLSLLLATQINVFFNSSPELRDLRMQLLVPPTVRGSYMSLKFWIGFLLLANICVTVMGILATFTTWGMISSISDRNSHCLLRSSMGQYVTTLPPRLVVASLYLFLTWFLLFVVELVAAGPLLVGLVAFIVVLFFSIVVPLSAFGRLIMHTGAMAERPVLSEELETELLPTGLHASLVIRAHHHQRRNTSVTNQYRRAQQLHHQRQQQQQQEEQELLHQEQEAQRDDPDDGEARTVDNDVYFTGIEDDDNDDDHTPSHNNTTTLRSSTARHHRSTSSDVTRFASDNDEDREEPDQFVSLASESTTTIDDLLLVGNRRRRKQSSTTRDDGTTPKNTARSQSETADLMLASKQKKPKTASSTTPASQHLRMETTDAVLFLPPAAILNMSLSRRELKDLIDNTIDTSSVGALPPQPEPHIALFSTRFISDNRTTPPVTEEIPSSTSNLQPVVRVPPPYPNTMQSASNFEFSHATRHHRRASSSRFLLMSEWEQESSIRDLYGAAPPADLPREIMLVEEQHEQHERGNGNHLQPNATTDTSVQFVRASSARWSPGSIFGRSGVRGGRASGWILSPYSVESEDDDNDDGKMRRTLGLVEATANTTVQTNTLDPLSQPLLPDLHDVGSGNGGDDAQDEETGVGLNGAAPFCPSP